MNPFPDIPWSYWADVITQKGFCSEHNMDAEMDVLSIVSLQSTTWWCPYFFGFRAENRQGQSLVCVNVVDRTWHTGDKVLQHWQRGENGDYPQPQPCLSLELGLGLEIRGWGWDWGGDWGWKSGVGAGAGDQGLGLALGLELGLRELIEHQSLPPRF